MLLYLQIKMTIISWHTHTTPSHAVQEEDGSPRNPCELPVILPCISTREKVIERTLNVSVAVYERPWCGQPTAIPGSEMTLCTVRGSASVRVCGQCGSGGGTPPTAWAANIHRHTNTPSVPLRTSLSALLGNESLTANRHWSCTAPKWRSRHVNIRTASQELGVCLQRPLLSWLSGMAPADITAWPPIPNPLKIQAQLRVLVETFDKRL